MLMVAATRAAPCSDAGSAAIWRANGAFIQTVAAYQIATSASTRTSTGPAWPDMSRVHKEARTGPLPTAPASQSS